MLFKLLGILIIMSVEFRTGLILKKNDEFKLCFKNINILFRMTWKVMQQCLDLEIELPEPR